MRNRAQIRAWEWMVMGGYLWGVLSLAGCLKANYGEEPFACQATGLCPEGYLCIQGICQNKSTVAALDGAVINKDDLSSGACQTVGKIEEQGCGLCNSGRHQRTCQDNGIWSNWGSCTNELTHWPQDPTTKQIVCPPYNQPVVYFSAHPYDVILGAGGDIARQKAAGRHVFIELLTNGENASAIRAQLNDQSYCMWHGYMPKDRHTYNLSEADFGKAFAAELVEAAKRLGVNGVYLSGYAAGSITAEQVKARTQFWTRVQNLSSLTSGAPVQVAIRGCVGTADSFPEPMVGLGIPADEAEEHQTVMQAIIDEKAALAEQAFYYTYYYAPGNGSSYTTIKLSSTEKNAKSNALDAFKVWAPTSGNYAIGYHGFGTYADKKLAKAEEYW